VSVCVCVCVRACVRVRVRVRVRVVCASCTHHTTFAQHVPEKWLNGTMYVHECDARMCTEN